MEKPKKPDELHSESIIRYDINGRPTFFTIPDSLVKITEEEADHGEHQEG